MEDPMGESDFLRRLKADAEAQDPRKALEAVAATPPRPASPGARKGALPGETPDKPGQDDDNDDDSAEIQRLIDVQKLIRSVDAEKPDARLKQADTLLSQAIEQERTEDTGD
jgi:hypothetical protein